MAAQITNVRVWDWPVRLFHWLLVIAIIGLFVTGKVGGNWMEWHEKIGYFVLGLILFRVVWGFVGTYHARFVNFVRGPKTIIAYTKSLFKKDSPRHLGHNPMGAISVLAFLLVVGFQAISGLFADDDIMLRGPYASMVGSEWSGFITKLHKWNSDLILILIGIHIAAILFYMFVKKDNLIKAMFTGKKSSADGQFRAEVAEKPRRIWLSWFIAVTVGMLVYLVASRFFLVR
jgi:cytochrome b